MTMSNNCTVMTADDNQIEHRPVISTCLHVDADTPLPCNAFRETASRVPQLWILCRLLASDSHSKQLKHLLLDCSMAPKLLAFAALAALSALATTAEARGSVPLRRESKVRLTQDTLLISPVM